MLNTGGSYFPSKVRRKYMFLARKHYPNLWLQLEVLRSTIVIFKNVANALEKLRRSL